MLARFKTSHEVRRESECGPKMGLAGREPDIQQGGAEGSSGSTMAAGGQGSSSLMLRCRTTGQSWEKG